MPSRSKLLRQLPPQQHEDGTAYTSELECGGYGKARLPFGSTYDQVCGSTRTRRTENSATIGSAPDRERFMMKGTVFLPAFGVIFIASLSPACSGSTDDTQYGGGGSAGDGSAANSTGGAGGDLPDGTIAFDANSADGQTSAGQTLVYAHNDTTLYSIDPTDPSLKLTKIGTFDCVGSSGEDSSMTDLRRSDSRTDRRLQYDGHSYFS